MSAKNFNQYDKLPKRLKKEILRLDKSCPKGISVKPHEDNFRYFDIEIDGPPETPYEGGVFQIELFLTKEYPMKPPKCRFLTRIYHPNVDKIGRICLDVLKDKWTPALTISRLCLSIQVLMQVFALYMFVYINMFNSYDNRIQILMILLIIKLRNYGKQTLKKHIKTQKNGPNDML